MTCAVKLALAALILTGCDSTEGEHGWKHLLAKAKAARKIESEICFTVADDVDIAGRYCLRELVPGKVSRGD